MSSAQPKILAVDDQRDNLITLQAVLRDALPNCTLLTAQSGPAALGIARDEDPDAILLDIVMPNMDGFEVCRTLKEDPRLKDIPVIFLTALGTNRESRLRALELGAEGFLGKPWNDQELVAQIRAMVKLKAAHRMRRMETEKLEELVVERTWALEKELAERKRVEEALRVSNMNWRNTFNAITDIVCVISTEHHILEINDAGCLALGRGKDQILGRKCFELVHGRTSPIPGCPCRQSVTDRKPCMSEYEDGGKCYRLVAWPTMNERGEVVALAHIVEDITQEKRAIAERDRLERQVRASQKMEAVGGLAGGIAHDFNNLLNVIMNFTELALDSIGEGDPVRGQLGEVMKASDRAAALTRQLLAFGRKQILKPVPLDLGRVAAEMEKMLRRILGEDIALVPLLAPNLGLVMADPSQIEQVIMNLAVNARHAMPAGGKLALTTANVELDGALDANGAAMKAGSYVMLVVADTGCGMDAKTRERIFEPFFTTKEQGRGTGLGLSTVYGIVRQSGGEIVVDSEPGKGTSFKIYLPRSEASAAVVVTTHAVPALRLTGNETVLVVEDEAGVRDLARQGLTRAGYAVLSASNGSEALLLCEKSAQKIDLLLTDIVMPRMGGPALAEELAKLRPSTKVLYMSGYAPEAVASYETIVRGSHFLAKPFSLTDLRRKVREVLDSN